MSKAEVIVTWTFDVLSFAVLTHHIAEMQEAINGIERMRWEREWSSLTGEYWPYP